MILISKYRVMKKINCKINFIIGLIVLLFVSYGSYLYLTTYTEYYSNSVNYIRQSIVNNIATKYMHKENSINLFEEELTKKGYRIRRFYNKPSFLKEWDIVRKNPKKEDSLRVTILRNPERTVTEESYFVG